MKNFIEKQLRIVAKKILIKYKPTVVGITGSVGKTSAREAVYSILISGKQVRMSSDFYNNWVGSALTIIGIKGGGRSNLKWLLDIFRGYLILFKKVDYPEILVLEMAVEGPGEMKQFADFVSLDIAVITHISESHIEYFKDIDSIVKEKFGITKCLKKDGLLILNSDNKYLQKIKRENKDNPKFKIIDYGFEQKAEIEASNSELNLPREFDKTLDKAGLTFRISHEGNFVPVYLPNVFGKEQVYAAMVATTIGLQVGFNLVQIAERLGNYMSPTGRLKLLPGIKKTLILDDTYNASPVSMKSAIETLGRMPDIIHNQEVMKIAVLGDMNGLGDLTDRAHRAIGRLVVENNIDVLITVGQKAEIITKGALKKGLPEEAMFKFGKVEEAGKFLQEKMKQGDIILIKGSEEMRMERIVKEIMMEPLKADVLLVQR